MTDKILFAKGARRDAQLSEESNRLPTRFETEKAVVETPAGTYATSEDRNWIYLTPYAGGKRIAIPIHRAQTYIETDAKPVDPFAAK